MQTLFVKNPSPSITAYGIMLHVPVIAAYFVTVLEIIIAV
jgi:hypothetical protein